MVTPTRSPVNEPGPTVTATNLHVAGPPADVFQQFCRPGARVAALRCRGFSRNSAKKLAVAGRGDAAEAGSFQGEIRMMRLSTSLGSASIMLWASAACRSYRHSHPDASGNAC